MSYIIEPKSVKSFITDEKMKLPRFQRKATWKDKQNFELCISIFQDYPIGVVIVNKEPDCAWLLDGRQRLSALKEMRANPNSVYDWAKTYIGFKPKEDEQELRRKYWNKVEEYLQKDKTQDDKDEVELDGENICNELVEDSFNAERQRQGLETLLNIILMVHQVTKVKGAQYGAWQRIFDFSEYFERLGYAPTRENSHINPVRLREFILMMENQIDGLTTESFCEYFEDNCPLKESKREKFKAEVQKNWTDIRRCVEVIIRTEKVLDEARIGIIRLTNVSPLDAQNIFSRINSGGTQLKAEELLSAKPFWNEPVYSSDPGLKKCVKDLYVKLEVEPPAGIVRWDLAATLLHRINDGGLVFGVLDSEEKLKLERVTLGFKLLSAIFVGGISAKSVNELEKKRDIDWADGIEELVGDLNKVCEILLDDDFFRFLREWRRSLRELIGNAPTLEFIVITYLNWKEKGSPTAGTKQKAVARDARALFDRLVFEYAVGTWRGSGDHKMAANVKDWKARLQAVSNGSWLDLVKGASVGDYNGQVLPKRNLVPIVYYSVVLKHCMPAIVNGYPFEVDHIIPQAMFEENSTIDKRNQDCLANLSLLPKKENGSKSDKTLKDISDPIVRKRIEEYSGIPESDFDKYSDITHFDEMRDLRIEILSELFGNRRTSLLSN